MNLKNYRRIIKGDKIYLKTLETENATKEYCDWLNDEEVNRYLETRRTTIPELHRYIDEKMKSEKILFLGIFYKENGKHIGNLKIELLPDGKTADFGMLIGDKNYWGKGIATEATRLIVDFAFDVLNLEAVSLGVLAENMAAKRVYEKVGFKIKEIQKQAVSHNGKLYDNIIMVIEKNEREK